MEYTPQHQMFDQKRLQILNMYNNAPDILKGKEDNESEDEEDELEFEDEEEEVEEIEKGDTEEDFEEEGEEDDDFEDNKELTKSEAFNILESSFELDLVKGGEGSKGGKVIGHTKSGKPIYDSHSHESHKDFSSEDHKDAYQLHDKTKKELGSKIQKLREGDDRENHSEANKLQDQYDHHDKQGDKHFDSKNNDPKEKIADLKAARQAIKQDTSIPYEERGKKLDEINSKIKKLEA